MAKDNRNSKRNSTPANSSTERRMVLRVKSREKMKLLAATMSTSSSSIDDYEDERRGGRRRRSSSSSINKDKKKKKKKPITKQIDPNMPKKPPTAFFYFLEDFRKEYKEQNPDVKTMRDIGKACGEKWKTMTYEEKVQYYDIATEKRREFDQAMAEYIRRKESGGEEETEDESEYDE